MATLVLHVNREALHHGAEIALLRDLYANRYLAGRQHLLLPSQRWSSCIWKSPGRR